MHNKSLFHFLLAIFLLFCLVLAQNSDIPRKFLGAFLYDRSDNLDAYLAAKGFDAAIIQQFKMPKLTRILFPLSPGKYRMLIGTGVQGSEWVKGSKKNADWTFLLGNEFQAKYWDGNDHKILFKYDAKGGRLIERHKVVGTQTPPEEYVYQIDGEGNLELHVMFNGVELIHHYKHTD